MSKQKSVRTKAVAASGVSTEKCLSVSKATQRIKANHQRQSNERHVITNEGPRKAIRDFNVFEMQGRKATAPTKTPK